MKKVTKGPSNKTAQALLEKYNCPVPFHQVRTHFLGNIAAPVISVSPLRVIEGLWGGELPTFETIDQANELFDILLKRLWNDLTRHQKRSQPFRLARMTLEPTAAALGHLALIRVEELDGFLDALFNGEDIVDLPERAHDAVKHLSELRAMMAAICELVSRDPLADDRTQIDLTFVHVRELTRIMETEIHEAVLSCSRARRQMTEGIPTDKPTLH